MKQKRETLGQKVMANVLKVAYLKQLSDTDLAGIMGVSSATISNRKKKPESLTIEEIDNFCLATHTGFDEMVK